MIYIAQLFCIIGAIMIVSILRTCNPINTYIPSAIMSSVLVLFFGAAALSIKENLTKKGGIIPLSNKVIGTIILLVIYGFGAKYFIASWNGEKISSKKKTEQVMNEPITSEGNSTEQTLTNDSTMLLSEAISDSSVLENSGLISDSDIKTPTLKAQFTLVWMFFVCIFIFWIMVSGGEQAKPISAKK